MTVKSKKIKIFIVAAFVLFVGLVVYFVGVPLCRFIGKPEEFRSWIDDKGLFGQILYIFMVVFQVVVAIVPGEPFEIGAGYAFGIWQGTLLFYIGAALGGIIVFYIGRKFGHKALYLFFDKEKIDNLKYLKNTKNNRALFFLIFALPGTPKDLLSYFAGITDMSFGQWMFISLVGRIPSVMTSIIGGNQMGEKRYVSAIIVFAATAVLTVAGWLIYKYIEKKKSGNSDEKTGEEPKIDAGNLNNAIKKSDTDDADNRNNTNNTDSRKE